MLLLSQWHEILDAHRNGQRAVIAYEYEVLGEVNRHIVEIQVKPDFLRKRPIDTAAKHVTELGSRGPDIVGDEGARCRELNAVSPVI